MSVEEKSAEHWLGEILAVLHGDGGHYLEQHGMAKATEDALEKYYRMVKDLDRYEEALKEIAEDWAQPARSIAQEVLAELQKEENLTGGEIMSKEKSTQKSSEGYPNTKIMGPKGGNPTNKGGINRPTKGQ